MEYNVLYTSMEIMYRCSISKYTPIFRQCPQNHYMDQNEIAKIEHFLQGQGDSPAFQTILMGSLKYGIKAHIFPSEKSLA